MDVQSAGAIGQAFAVIASVTEVAGVARVEEIAQMLAMFGSVDKEA